MAQQIAELGTSLKTLKDGYKVVSGGLDGIQKLKNGSFDLNADFFKKLKQASPAVTGNPKVNAIISDQQNIMQLFRAEIAWQQQAVILGTDEIAYIQAVYDNLLTACDKDVDELAMVTQSGTQMSDAERIKRTDRIYNEMENKYGFAVSFTRLARQLATSRKEEKQQNQVIRKLYDIN